MSDNIRKHQKTDRELRNIKNNQNSIKLPWVTNRKPRNYSDKVL
jgi:hypothetical protein